MKVLNQIRKWMQPYKDKQHYNQFLKKVPHLDLMDNINKLSTRIERKSVLKVVGCGPSANEAFINRHDCDYMVVNAYSVMPEYRKYQPKYYVVMDTAFFSSADYAYVWHKIIDDTDWDMYFFVPVELQTSDLDAEFAKNNHIKMVYFNGNTYYYGPESKRDYCYDHNLAIPNPYNVMIGCLYVGISLGYETINMYGVEYDMVRDLHVDKHNRPFFTARHCYDSDLTGEDTDVKDDPCTQTVEQILHGFVITMQSHREIQDMAKRRGVQIWNCTKGSLIDVFDRKEE